VNGQQGRERQEADVLAEHVGRAVAHATSNGSRMEAIAESPGPFVRAIDDADGRVVPGAKSRRSSGKIGASSLAGVAIIPTSPATARVARLPSASRAATTALLVNVAKTCGALFAPLDPAGTPAPDPKIRGSGDLGEEDRGLRAIGDFLKTDLSGLIWDIFEERSVAKPIPGGHGGDAARYPARRRKLHRPVEIYDRGSGRQSQDSGPVEALRDHALTSGDPSRADCKARLSIGHSLASAQSLARCAAPSPHDFCEVTYLVATDDRGAPHGHAHHA